MGLREDSKHEDYYHKINHSFKPKIVVPLSAISDNIDFLFGRPKFVRLDKNFKAEVLQFKEIHILGIEAERTIQSVYNMSVFDFMKRWYKKYNYMDSMSFLLIELKEIKEKENE